MGFLAMAALQMNIYSNPIMSFPASGCKFASCQCSKWNQAVQEVIVTGGRGHMSYVEAGP